MSLKNIIAHLDKNGFLVVTKLPCISHGENVSVGINVSAEQNFLSQMPDGTNFYFEFKSADGQKQVCGPVLPQNNELACAVTNSVLCCPGEAQVQIVATDKNSDYIFKSSVASFFVSQSINATDKDFVRDDLLANINKLLDEMYKTNQNTAQTGEQLQSLVDDVNQKLSDGEFVGEKGEKGDKGDVPLFQLEDGHLYTRDNYGEPKKLIGRAQGAGVFTTTSPSSVFTRVPRDTLYPVYVTPLDGDCLIFPDGSLHVINDVGSSDTIGCRAEAFSIKGAKGDDGKDGVSITDVRQRTITDNGEEVHLITFYFSDNTTRTVNVKNGENGKDGMAGGANGLVVQNQNDDNVLHLTQDGQILGEGIVLPQGGGAGSTNYLVNSNFAINQRGQSVYDQVGQGRIYTVDRWAKNNASGNVVVKPVTNGVHIDGMVTQNGELFVQPVEPSCVSGKKVTLSAKATKAKGPCRLGIVAQGSGQSGTPVPNDGTVVDRIYFNTSLPAEEVIAVFDSLSDWFVAEWDESEVVPIYYLAINAEFSAAIVIGKMQEGYSVMAMKVQGENENTTEVFSSQAGWTGVEYFDFGFASVDGVALGAPFVAGSENDKLANVISATQTFGSGAGRTEKFVSLKQGENSITADIPDGATSVVCGVFGNTSGAVGTPLPTNGLPVENIYFNLNASLQQVAQRLLQIAPQPGNVSYLFADTSDTIRLCVVNQDGDALLKDEKSGTVYFSSQSGWSTDFSGIIPVGLGGVSFINVDGLSVPVGLFNGDVTAFVSATKFFDGYGKVGVPVDGSQQNIIYFDPTVSIEDTVKVIKNANLPWVDMGDGETFRYYVAAAPESNGEQMSVTIVKNSNGYAILLWGYIDVFVSCDNFNDTYPMSGVAGWQQERLSLWGLDNAMPWQSVTNAIEGAGTHNDMLAQIIYVMGKTDLSIGLEWAKLEVGKKSTEYLAPQPAGEMVECQRYYQKFSCDNLVGYAKDNSTLSLALPLPNVINQNAVLVCDDNAQIFGVSGNATPTLAKMDDNVVQLSFATQNLAQGNVYAVQNCHGALDAEIY